VVAQPALLVLGRDLRLELCDLGLHLGPEASEEGELGQLALRVR